MIESATQSVKQYLLASDFDQTLSFNDSGLVLSELTGISGEVFERKVAILAVQNLVQQGGELTYLLLHDPEYRSRIRREHLIQAGKEVRLKKNIRELSELLAGAVEGYRFDFHVISASPQEVVESALEGIIPADHIHGTQLRYDSEGRVESVVRVNAGYGKVAVLDDLQKKFQIGAAHHLRRRRQLGYPRHAARQPPRRSHHRRVAGSLYCADRQADCAQ